MASKPPVFNPAPVQKPVAPPRDNKPKSVGFVEPPKRTGPPKLSTPPSLRGAQNPPQETAPPPEKKGPPPKKPEKPHEKKGRKKKHEKKGSKLYSDDPVELKKLLAARDKEIHTLKKKLKKSLGELKRCDETILIQEEEIGRLNKKITAGGTTSASELSDASHTAGCSDNEEGEPTANSKRKARKIDPGMKPLKDFELTHHNLFDGFARFEDADLALIAHPSSSGKGGTINAHAGLITSRCQYFEKALTDKYASKKKVPKKKTLDVKNTDVDTLTHVMEFLYKGNADRFMPKLRPVEIVLLVISARRFGLHRLTWLCEARTKEMLSLNNVVLFLKALQEHKDLPLKTMCCDFLLVPENWTKFVVRKEAVTELGMELFSELVSANATRQASGNTSKGIKIGRSPSNRYRTDFKKLYSRHLYCDATITVRKRKLKCHRYILEAASMKLHETLSREKFPPGDVVDITDYLSLGSEGEFKGKMSVDAMECLLKYIYYGDVVIPPLEACILIPFARKFKLANLQTVCERRIQESVTDSKVSLKILSVTYLSVLRNRADMREQVKAECIEHIVGNLKEISFKQILSMDSEFSTALAVDLLIALQKTFG